MLESLFEYQRTGALWLAPKAQALLADDMGLGKSAQAVYGCDLVGAENILVLCPASVRVNWEREFRKFSPFDRPCKVFFVGGEAVPEGPGVFVCSYDLITVPTVEKAKRRLKSCTKAAQEDPEQASEMLRAQTTMAQMKKLNLQRKAFLRALYSRQWDVLIVDEAHYLKERDADRTRRVYGYTSQHPGFSQRAKRVWRLTGTPAPNNASELYTHLKSAGILTEPYWDFVFRFCRFDRNGDKIVGHKNVDELKRLLEPFMLRRKKEDVLKDLPPIRYQTVAIERSAVDLDPWFWDHVRKAGEEAFLKGLEENDTTLRRALQAVSGGDAPYRNRLGVLESMAQSMATLRRYIGMAKMPNCCAIIEEELKSGALDKVVIFAVHRDVIELTRQRLRKFGPVTLYGGTPPQTRQANIDKFMTDPKCRVFIGNVHAAGTGITLTSACEVAFFEQDWVPATNAQAAMRVHRIGQTRPVRVRVFELDKSVDEQVQETLLRKMRELTKIF